MTNSHSQRTPRCSPSRRKKHLVVLLAASACALSACGSSSSPGGKASANSSGTTNSSSSSSTPALSTSTPAAKGPLQNLTWDLPDGEPTTLDYVKAGTQSTNLVVANMCDTLRRVNPNLTYGPNVETSFKYSPDHLKLTYTIRQGIKFWDGTSLTAADVAYSLSRNMNAADSPVNGYVYTNVKSITATGPYTVVVTFKKPDALFNDEMAGAPGEIAEKAYIEKEGSAYGTAQGGVMCSGPYKLVKWTPGKEIQLAANTSYWNKKLIPKAKTVTLKFITDTGTLVQALKSGAVDGAYEIPDSVIPALEGKGAGRLYLGKAPEFDELLANNTPVGNDVNIRKALSLILQRAAMAQKVYYGAAEPAYNVLPRPMWDKRALSTYESINKSLKVPTVPELSAARALIKNDPVAKKPITINAEAGDQLLINVITLMQQEAKAIGLNVQLVVQQPLEFGNSFYESTARTGIDFIFDQTYIYVPDPLDYLTDNVTYGGSLTYIKYPGGQQASHYINEARATLDPTHRAMLIGKALKIATAEQLVIPLVTRDEVMYMNKSVTGAIPTWGYFAYPSLAVIGSSK